MKEALVTQCTEGLMKGEGGRREEGEGGGGGREEWLLGSESEKKGERERDREND